MACSAPWMLQIIDQIEPPLNVCGDCVISCQISDSLSFQTSVHFPGSAQPSYPTFVTPPFGAVFTTAPFAETGSANNEVEDFLGKGDDDAAGQSQETVGTLAGIVGLEAETDLHNAPAKQNQPTARMRPKIKSLRLLTTVMGSPAAKAVTPMLMVSVRARTAIT